jgi:hypothetical protein
MNTAKTQRQKRTSAINKSFQFQEMAAFEKVSFSEDQVNFTLTNGSVVTLPISQLPKLQNASPEQRENFEIQGHFIFWDDVDEVIGVKNLFNGSIQYQRMNELK